MTADGSSERSAAVLSDLVERLCTQCLEPMGVDGGGVTLTMTAGHGTTLCATDAVAARIEELQFVLGEGPCIDATTQRSPVLVADLLDAREGVQARWPAFLDAAGTAGVRAVFSFPLRIGAISLGAVDFYRGTPGGLSAGQLSAALLAADALSLVLLDRRTIDASRATSSQDSGLRLAVHNAAGMAMVQMGSTIEHALVRLRGVAFAEERPLDDVAADVVAGRLRFRQEDA